MNLKGFYTTLIVAMNIVAHLDTNLMLPSDIPTLTPESIKSRIRGSKYVLVVEQSMIMTIWGCKFCLLLMYSKLTFGLKQQWAAKAVGVYVVCNLILMEILYFGVVRLAQSQSLQSNHGQWLMVFQHSGVDPLVNIGQSLLRTNNAQPPSTIS